MIIQDRSFYFYLAMCFLSALLAAAFDFVTSSVFSLSDKYYFFVFVPMVQIGQSIVLRYFMPVCQIRYPARRSAMVCQIVYSLCVCFASACACSIPLYLYHGIIGYSIFPDGALDVFLRFFVGSVLLVAFMLCVQVFLSGKLAKHAPTIACVYAILEQKGLAEALEHDMPWTVLLPFCWIHSDWTPWNYLSILSLAAVLIGISLYRVKWCDYIA